MNAFADAWSHANNVRMWMSQASSELREASDLGGGGLIGRWITKGRTSKAKIDEAIESLAKARLAWQDLQFWLGKAGQACPPPPTVLDERFLPRQTEKLFTDGWKINDGVVRGKRGEIDAQVAALDGLIAWLDEKQRAA